VQAYYVILVDICDWYRMSYYRLVCVAFSEVEVVESAKVDYAWYINPPLTPNEEKPSLLYSGRDSNVGKEKENASESRIDELKVSGLLPIYCWESCRPCGVRVSSADCKPEVWV